MRRLVVALFAVRAAFASTLESFLAGFDVGPDDPAPDAGSVALGGCSGELCSERAVQGLPVRAASALGRVGRCPPCAELERGRSAAARLQQRLVGNVSLSAQLGAFPVSVDVLISTRGKDLFGRTRPAPKSVEFALAACGIPFWRADNVVFPRCRAVWIWCARNCPVGPSLSGCCSYCLGLAVARPRSSAGCGGCGAGLGNVLCTICARAWHRECYSISCWDYYIS